MPIVAVVLLTLAFWVGYWFVRMGGIDHIQAKKAQRKEEERVAKARESARTASLRAVEDARDAATILMLLLARADGDPTRQQITEIEKIIRSAFGYHDQELTERMTAARFIASRAESFEQAAGVFSDLLNKRLTGDEQRELIDMLEAVARIEGPSPTQIEAIGVLDRRLGFAPVR